MPEHATRAHALLSASSAHRWLNCPPSAVAVELYERQDTPFTMQGTKAHEVAEVIASGAPYPPIGNGVTDEMLAYGTAYKEYIQSQYKVDHPMVLLEQRVDFSAWVPGGFGTCDCILLQGGTMTVIDYKYGKGVAVSAEDNPQMRLYALGALSDYGFAYEIENVEMHIFQPRINNISTETITVDALMAWAETVKPIAQQAEQGQGQYKAGSWCTFCPHAGQCRMLKETCLRFVTIHDGKKAGVPILSPWELSEVLQMEPMISLWLRKVKEQATTKMLEGEDVPGWKVVEGKLGNRKWVDEMKVFQALRASGYEEEDITETKILSPAGMDKSIGKKKVEELLSELIERAPGAPTIVPESDKRQSINRLAEAQNDFN